MPGPWVGFEWALSGPWLGLEWAMAGPWVGLEWAISGPWKITNGSQTLSRVCPCPMLVKSLSDRQTVGHRWVIATINGMQTSSRICLRLVFVQSLCIGLWARMSDRMFLAKVHTLSKVCPCPEFVQSMSNIQFWYFKSSKCEPWTLFPMSKVCPDNVRCKN